MTSFPTDNKHITHGPVEFVKTEFEFILTKELTFSSSRKSSGKCRSLAHLKSFFQQYSSS